MAKAAKKRDTDQLLLIRELKTPKEAFRDLRNYLAGQFVGATRDDKLLDEVLKCLFCNLYVETGKASPVPDGLDLSGRVRHVRSVFAKVQRDFAELYEPGTEILLDPEGISRVMKECYFSLIDANSDPIGDAYEVFVGSESRGRHGQFFTPRPVTDLLVKAVAPQPGETIMDPACGAGGFLTSVARYYLAQGAVPDRLAALSTQTFFGLDKDAYLVKLAKCHIALVTGGHPQISCVDSIALKNGSKAFQAELPQDGFDVLLTNPPFGTRIVAARPDTLRTFELAWKWRRNAATALWERTSELQTQVPPQVLFVERCLSLLKEGGRLGIVLPESILSNKSYRYVREYLMVHSDVEAVIAMPEALFKTSGKGGTHTKTCLLIARKIGSKMKRTAAIFMAEAKWCGHDSRARMIPNNDLPAIADNLRLHREENLRTPSPLGYVVEKKDIVSTVLCPRYYDPELNAELERLRRSHDLLVLGDLVKQGVLSITTGDELGKLSYGTGEVPFIRTSDMSNWELKADPKHGVDRRIYEALRSKQDVRPHDILMVKDGTYLIGTCAIVTEADAEIIYQSHIYKIRVHEDKNNINPFLLLAVLSSPIVQRQVRSKQFTQDIIDSLGERINELILPIPKAANVRLRITESVKKAISHRVEARRLAKEARLAVVG